jgi:hypothetical protein
MADTAIPQRHRSGMQKLVKLSEDSFNELITALEGVEPTLFPHELSEKMESKLKGISSEDVSAIIASIMSLSSHRLHDDSTPEELAGQIAQSAKETGIANTDTERDSFKKRLIRFFELKTLYISSKALGILQSNENLFCTCRILTDVRPVFGTDAKEAPVAAVVVHMLDLSYHKDGGVKHLYLALDSLDIETLKEALNRAETKAETLKPLIKRAGVAFLDPSE